MKPQSRGKRKFIFSNYKLLQLINSFSEIQRLNLTSWGTYFFFCLNLPNLYAYENQIPTLFNLPKTSARIQGLIWSKYSICLSDSIYIVTHNIKLTVSGRKREEKKSRNSYGKLLIHFTTGQINNLSLSHCKIPSILYISSRNLHPGWQIMLIDAWSTTVGFWIFWQSSQINFMGQRSLTCIW